MRFSLRTTYKRHARYALTAYYFWTSGGGVCGSNVYPSLLLPYYPFSAAHSATPALLNSLLA